MIPKDLIDSIPLRKRQINNSRDKRTICAGNKLGFKDACQGDSGGPMILRIKNDYYLVGIISNGIGCGNPLLLGVNLYIYVKIYTRVSYYYKWINQIINS